MREFREVMKGNIKMWKSLTFIYANTNKLEQIMEDPVRQATSSDTISKNKYKKCAKATYKAL